MILLTVIIGFLLTSQNAEAHQIPIWKNKKDLSLTLLMRFALLLRWLFPGWKWRLSNKKLDFSFG